MRTSLQLLYDEFDVLIDICEDNNLKRLANKLRKLRDNNIPFDYTNIDNYSDILPTGSNYPSDLMTDDLIDLYRSLLEEERIENIDNSINISTSDLIGIVKKELDKRR